MGKLIRGPFRKREQPSAIMKFSAVVLVSALSALVVASPIIMEPRNPEPQGYGRSEAEPMGFKINKREAEPEADSGYRREDGVALGFKINKREADADAEPGYRREDGVALGFKINKREVEAEAEA